MEKCGEGRRVVDGRVDWGGEERRLREGERRRREDRGSRGLRVGERRR